VTDKYDAYVYDLDGTLVHLEVDWDEVAEDIAAVLRARGVDVAEADLWSMLERADETGYRRLVEERISEHEREGARVAERLPLAREFPRDEPVGVCSLNSETACRIALERYGLDSAVQVIVGRDTVDGEKPDPEPLARTVEALGSDPARTVFVGDSQRDAQTAQRAGTAFAYVSDWLER
jgi:phosphoglycolate phosphatase